MLGTDSGTYPNAVAATDAGAVTCPDARTFLKPDDGDARAHASTIYQSDARALITTVYINTLLKTDAVALLVGSLLERQGYG